MQKLIISAFFGLLGGFARAIVGTMKSLKKKKKFKWKYFLFTVIESGLIGLIVGMAYSEDPKVAVAMGYAGTDILEGLYKLKD